MRLLLPVLALTAACVHPQQETRDTVTLSPSFIQLRVDLNAGDVSVSVGDVTDVRVERIIRCRGDAEPELRAEVVDHVIVLEATGNRCSVDHLIVVPHTAEVRARTGAGSLDFRDLSSPLVAETGAGDVQVSGQFGTADLTTGAGDVDVMGMEGDLIVSTQAGAVRVDGLDAQTVVVTTDAGSVAVELVSRPEHVDLDSAAGRVSLDLPRGTYAIDASTAAGRVEVDNLLDDDASPRTLLLRSAAGDVRAAGYGS